MTKLGLHIIEPYRIKDYDTRIIASAPAVIKVVGGPTELGVLAHYAGNIRSRGTTYIARVFPFDQMVKDMMQTGVDPLDAALRMVEQLAGLVVPSEMQFVYYECGPNEPGDEFIPWLNKYYSWIVPRLAALEIKTCCFNFSVCHPPLTAWAQLGDALRAIHNVGPTYSIVGLHQYGLRGSMQDYADSFDKARVLRHRCIKELCDLKVVLTESGLDDPGWRKTNRGGDGYFADLMWLDAELQKDTNVLGAALYTLDLAPGWEPFRLDGDEIERLFTYWKQPAIVEVPTSPAPTCYETKYAGLNLRDDAGKMLAQLSRAGIQMEKLATIKERTRVRLVIEGTILSSGVKEKS